MAKLLLTLCLALSLHGQCTTPAGRLSTSFDCTAKLDRMNGLVKAYLTDRVKGGEIEAEKGRLVAHNKAETVVVWLGEGTNGEVKLRVEVRPAGSAPLLGESADTALALRRYLVRALQ